MMKEIKAFNIKINPLRRSEFLSIIETSLKNGHQIVQNGVNGASFNQIFQDKQLEIAINKSDLINIDGQSVVWGLRYLGFDIPERVACPDLAYDILQLAENKNYSVFLFGAQERSLLKCVRNLNAKYPRIKIAGYRNGYFNENDEKGIIEMINSAKTDILFLGMPSPKKEFFVEKYRHILNAKYIFGVGGFLDILSGYKKRAPKWMQEIGMEWFFRFLQEPVRMWKRYMIGNPNFIRLILKEKRKQKSVKI